MRIRTRRGAHERLSLPVCVGAREIVAGAAGAARPRECATAQGAYARSCVYDINVVTPRNQTAAITRMVRWERSARVAVKHPARTPWRSRWRRRKRWTAVPHIRTTKEWRGRRRMEMRRRWRRREWAAAREQLTAAVKRRKNRAPRLPVIHSATLPCAAVIFVVFPVSRRILR